MPKEAPKYEMDPSFWQLPNEPPPLYEEKDPLAIEGPPEDDEETPPEDEDEEYEGEEDPYEANKIFDQLGLPNYDDVEKRLGETEMTATRQRNYLDKVIKDAETRRRQVVALKSNATKIFNAGKITAGERDLAHNNSDKLQKKLRITKNTINQKLKQ